MSETCQFPGCQSDAAATYCEECRRAVRGPRSSTGTDWISLAFLAMGVLTFAIVAVAVGIHLVEVL